MFVINQECRSGMTDHIASDSIDAVVTDPPYGLSREPDAAEVLRHWLNGDDYEHTGGGFMGKKWDSFVPGPSIWREAFRCLKPGGYALVFAGSRTQDLMSMSLRLAGFEIRDCAMWLYGSGFPKSLDVGKAIDKRGGESVGWFGPWLKKWREDNGIKQKQISALFPSKTGGLTGCVANWELGFNLPTVEQFNTIKTAFNLPFENMQEAERKIVGKQSGSRLAVAPGQDNDRSGVDLHITEAHTDEAKQWDGWGTALKPAYEPIIIARKPLIGTVADNVLTHGTGAINIDGCRVGGERWPANVMHDGIDEDWSRYFYCPKTTKADRNHGLEGFRVATAGEQTGGRAEGSAGLDNPRTGAGRTGGSANHHPTVKPTELMRYLCRLVTPPGGTILDPFSGSGSTGRGAMLEGFNFIGFEMDPEYTEIANTRIYNALLTRT